MCLNTCWEVSSDTKTVRCIGTNSGWSARVGESVREDISTSLRAGNIAGAGTVPGFLASCTMLSARLWSVLRLLALNYI